MLEHQDILYVFGGELSFCNDQETPLWMYDIKVTNYEIILINEPQITGYSLNLTVNYTDNKCSTKIMLSNYQIPDIVVPSFSIRNHSNDLRRMFGRNIQHPRVL